jgi:segregation and condensation protein A
MVLQKDYFSLSNFEGSLDFLLCLLQKEEMDIYDVPIQKLIEQFLSHHHADEEDLLDEGAEFIGGVSYLIWLKSKTLLPREEQTAEFEEKIEDPRFEIIHHLIDYCRFKQAAKQLNLRQEQQQGFYFRGIEKPEWRKPLGIDHVSLEELSQLFQDMILRASQHPSPIQEENWRVSDKIQSIRLFLKEEGSLFLSNLLQPHQSRLEMIVIFLALLELIKSGELAVGREQPSGEIVIFAAQVSGGDAKKNNQDDYK